MIAGSARQVALPAGRYELRALLVRGDEVLGEVAWRFERTAGPFSADR